MLQQSQILPIILTIRMMEVTLVLSPFLNATPSGILTKNCNSEPYKYLMNTWNTLPPLYRRRALQNANATVKRLILDADTTVVNVAVSTEPAQVDKQSLEQFLQTDYPLEEPRIGSRTEQGGMPVDIDDYEEVVCFGDGGAGEPSVPHPTPKLEDLDDVRSGVAATAATLTLRIGSEDARTNNEQRTQEFPTQEFPSITNTRRGRILWLAARICDDRDWLAYSAGTRSFAGHPALRQRIEASKAAAATATFHRDQSRTAVLSDVDMATVCGHSDGDFYVVDMRKSAPVVTPETIAEVTRSAMVKGVAYMWRLGEPPMHIQ